MSKTDETALREFDQLVNMTAAELDDRLARPESEAVGQGAADAEPVGHASGRTIRAVPGGAERALDEGDQEHVRRGISAIEPQVGEDDRQRLGEPAHLVWAGPPRGR
jgi:Protein of unknown function (DUF3140).